MTTDWPRQFQRQAALEGWDVFFTGGDLGHAVYEIEKVDFPESDDGDELPAVFDDDYDAVRHVLREAARGSALHVRAVAFLALESPEELLGIVNLMLYGSYRTFTKHHINNAWNTGVSS